MRNTSDYDRIMLWVVGFLVASALAGRKALSMLDVKTQSDYKKAAMPLAVNVGRLTGINPTLAVTQAAHESNWGQSELTRTAHNHFGMTPGDKWLAFMNKTADISTVPPWSKGLNGSTHPVLYRKTTEYSTLPPNKIRYWEFAGDILDKTDDGKGGSKLIVNRAFRAYANDQESFDDWGNLISGNPRFALAYAAAKAGDITAFANGLAQAKYATDVAYAAKLTATAQTVANV